MMLLRDQTRCADGDCCPKSSTCRRWRALREDGDQPVWMAPFFHEDGDCGHYLPAAEDDET